MVKSLFRRVFKPESVFVESALDKIEAARSPAVILKQIRHLRWAYNNGYRPVAGYTIAEKREDGTLYIAIEMEKI